MYVCMYIYIYIYIYIYMYVYNVYVHVCEYMCVSVCVCVCVCMHVHVCECVCVCVCVCGAIVCIGMCKCCTAVCMFLCLYLVCLLFIAFCEMFRCAPKWMSVQDTCVFKSYIRKQVVLKSLSSRKGSLLLWLKWCLLIHGLHVKSLCNIQMFSLLYILHLLVVLFIFRPFRGCDTAHYGFCGYISLFDGIIMLTALLIVFRNRIRMYPALVNCTTIDWFSEWPLDALLEVADKYLSEMSLGSEEEVSIHRRSFSQLLIYMHPEIAGYFTCIEN